MSLAEVVAADVDASSSPTIPLFIHCPSPSSKRSKNGSSLFVQLLDGSSLFEAELSSSHKPRALDCSPLEYVAAVQAALSPLAVGQEPRFDFRWSRAKRTLTLMERAGFAMKFSAVEFAQVVDDASRWQQLLHQVATQQKERREEVEEKKEKILKLEKLLLQKESLLEAALEAKQKEEDRLFQGFCAVLNGKKDEIQRLKNELDRAQEAQSYGVQEGRKRKVAAPKRARKATGAKLKKKKQQEEEEEEDVDMSGEDSSREDSGGESTVTEEADDDERDERKKARRDAISAYSQLPTSLKPSSVQISSAEDLLSSMDDIIKNEEEVNEATQRGEASSQSVTLERVEKQSQVMESSKPRSTVARSALAVKVEPTPPPKAEPVKPAPPVDEPMDSEEEDILDMLS